MERNNKIRNVFADPEFWFILVFNLLIAWGYNNHLISQDTVIWIYFSQSVFIGLGNTVRMACLKKFETQNFLINNKRVEASSKTKWGSTLFFMVHYGMFHFVYFIFLIVISIDNGSKLDTKLVLLNMALIAGNTIISTWSTILSDREETPSMSKLFFTPYLRIVPCTYLLWEGFFWRKSLISVFRRLGLLMFSTCF